ncbi:hypothetical protein JCM8547_004249 [Rhodosporidiobolus lusitaniae]
MRTRGRKRSWLVLLVIAGGGSGIGGQAEGGAASGRGGSWGVLGVRGQSIELLGRWGQASALLSPNDDPTLLVISGKTTVAGQTVTSTPSTSSALSLDLSSPIPDLSSPPWTDLSSSGPISAYASLVPLTCSSALFFGGDATGDSTFAVQTGNDSSWTLALASSSSSSALASTWTHESTTLWPSQPQRRELAYTASATNGTLSRAWVYGGQRPDGSGTTFSELWELQVSSTSDAIDASTARWAAWSGSHAPPAMYDGTAVLVPSTKSGALPSIYLIGGAQVSAGTSSLVPLDSVWVFTPSDEIASGTWEEVEVSGSAPAGRRGHVALDVGDGKIWVQGGRSLDGATVFSDAAVLDTKKKSWTTVKSGEQAWGRSAAMVGETVVLAFGYGVNSATSTTLTVYAPSNDSYLSAYYPSFVTSAVVANPKASSGSSSAISSSGASATAGAAADPSSTGSSSSSSSSSSSTYDSDSTSSSDSSPSDATSSSEDSEDAPTSPQWTSPGAAGTTTPSSSNPSGDNDKSTGSEDSNGGTSKSKIAGAVVGSILGALALAAGGVFVTKRYRDHHRYGFTGDDEFGGAGGGMGGNGGSGLMAEHRTGGYASSEMYNLGKALPVNPATGSVGGRLGGVGTAAGGAMGALVGLFSPRERYTSTGAAGGRKRRFDMLKDEEESDVWDASLRGEGGWAQFADHDEKADDFSTPSLSGRGGTAIWSGFADTASDTLKSSTSYLGGALGGFIGLAGGSAAASSSQQQRELGNEKDDLEQDHEYASVCRPAQPTYADPSLTPIVEWDEDDEEDARTEPDDSRTLESHNTHSSCTHQTTSTYPTSNEASPSKVLPLARSTTANSFRPFSPAAPSLYGSSFNPPQPAVVAAAAGAFAALGQTLSRTSSATSSTAPAFLPRNSTHSPSWWSRLNKAHGGEVPTPTAFEAIRDPAPAPPLSLTPISENDPFADTASSPARRPSTRSLRPDEHGRFPSSGSVVGRFTHGQHDLSTSSTASSDVTATSSVMEERLRHMDVVQRIRTGSGGGASGAEDGTSSCDVTPTLGTTEEGAAFGRLPEAENPFADQESVVWAGSTARGAFSDVGASTPAFRSSTPPPVPALPFSVAIQPPTPTYNPPSSPRKARLAGPRPLPPPSSTSPFSASPSSSSPLPLPLPTRSNSVKDLVAKFDGRGENSSENLAVSSSSPAGTPRRKARKVEHGLVRKPVLYVANPDG